MAGKNNALDNILKDAPTEKQETVPQKATHKELMQKANQEYAKAEAKTRDNHKALMEEPKVKVELAPMYQPYFGENMTVSLNGLTIYVPVDGRAYKVPKSFAAIIQGRRRMVNDQLTRRTRLANVKGNRESYAGELSLVPR